MTQIRVLVIDDHPVMRQGIGNVLAGAGLAVADTAGSAAEALQRLVTRPVDVVLVDLHLGEGPAGDGVALLGQLARLHPGLACLVYSMREDAATIRRSLAAGARGYVTKAEVWETLATAIREAAAGRTYLSPVATRALELQSASASGDPGFSEREREVFRLLGDGYSVAEIGERMQISARTVETYGGRLIAKLGLSGMRDLRRSAIAAREG